MFPFQRSGSIAKEAYMADYDPPQPFWKRAIAGVLDFLLIFFAGGFAIQKLTGGTSDGAGSDPAGIGFKLEGLPALVLFVLVIAYFAGLGRTGGTVFQRLFGMHRRA